MATGLLAAILVIAVPALACAPALAAFCGNDATARALAPAVGLALVVGAVEAAGAAGLTGLSLAAAAGAVAVAGLIAAVRVRVPSLHFLVAPGIAAIVTGAIFRPIWRLPEPVILGYGVADDAALHTIVSTDILRGASASIPGSSFAGIASFVAGNGYPTGFHSVLASVTGVTGDVFSAYQPTIAIFCSAVAFPAYWLARRCDCGTALAVVAAIFAAAGYLQVGYYAESFGPQLAATPFILTGIALACEAERTRRIAPATLAGICLGAAIGCYSTGVLVYAAALGGITVPVLLWRKPPLWLLACQLSAAAIGTIAIVIPIAGTTLGFLGSVRAIANETGAGDLGNLPAPLDPLTMLGAWVGPDFRYGYAQRAPTIAASAVALVLLACAAVHLVRSRRIDAIAMVLCCGIALAVVDARSGAYYTAKSYQVMAVPVTCAIFAGASAVASYRGRLAIAATLVAALALGGYAVAAKRAVGSEQASLRGTPPWIRELRTLDRPGLGLALVPGAWVKVALPHAGAPLDPLSRGALLQDRTGPNGLLDANSFSVPVLRKARWIVQYRHGGLAPPPPPFHLSRVTRTFELWERPEGDLPSLRRHRILGPDGQSGYRLEPGASLTLPANASRGLLSGRPIGSMQIALAGEDLRRTAWQRWHENPTIIVNIHLGQPLVIRFDSPTSSRYLFSLAGVDTPDLRVTVDGVALPHQPLAGFETMTPLGSRELAAGPHLIRIVAGATTSYLRLLSIDDASNTSAAPICVGDSPLRLSFGHAVRLPSALRG